MQGSAAFLLGCGGAWRLLSAHGLSVALPAGVALLLGAICYGAAFLLVERRVGQGGSFYFYSTAGLLLALAGTSALGLWARPSRSPGTRSASARPSLGRLHDRMTLRVHGALFVAAAALATGLVVDAVLALGGAATAVAVRPGLDRGPGRGRRLAAARE